MQCFLLCMFWKGRESDGAEEAKDVIVRAESISIEVLNPADFEICGG